MRCALLAGAAAGSLAGCTSSGGARSTGATDPAPVRVDPAVEHQQHMDEAWQWLAATYDRDGDGRLTAAEHGRGAEAFSHLDRDGDGFVTRADLARGAILPPELGIPLLLPRLYSGGKADAAPIAPMAAALAAVDRDGDGRVSVVEFGRVVGRGGPPSVDAFGTLLAGMDSDRDGLLSAPEISRWLAERDADGDGRLALREPARDRLADALPIGWVEPDARRPAPDFLATRLEDGVPILRSALQRRRPMALIFGSFT